MPRREQHLARKAAGLCGSCGSRSPVPGKATCQECLDAKKALSAKRKTEGKCVRHPTRDVVLGRIRCQECLDAGKARVAKRKTEGKCVNHPTRDVVPGRIRCQECLDASKNVNRFLKHGTTRTAEEKRKEKQQGLCPICEQPLGDDWSLIAIDHDHACCPGKVSCGRCIRGLIHKYRCNSQILPVVENCQKESRNALAYLYDYANDKKAA